MKQLFMAMALSSVAMAAGAMQIVLGPSSVIGSSGSFGTGFQASRILDEQVGAVTDKIRGTYWLNPSNTGASPVFITVDLGSAFSMASFEIFNTHNDVYFDRGTGAFSILAGNEVFDEGGGNFRLTGPTTTLVSGTLAAGTTVTPPAQTFVSASSDSFRYLSFVPLGTASLNPIAGPTAYGLNELRVFATAVPEPSVWLLFVAGLSMAISLSRLRPSGEAR